ncbi:MAG: hypothetical protein COW84_10545 [Gammaproteobacteria bacterium CG22_combo_CG10-13_8_21_14_all_40_8]|nr:MAG: hypothetical protein COW84_10545 [Gammaproteobacteria bacterium CG22_combo_CG10-13_8_21_14_all_40_8]
MTHQTVAAATNNADRTVKVTSKDLPLYCPSEKSQLWAEHPRVYLKLDHDNQSNCPYCNTTYLLES